MIGVQERRLHHLSNAGREGICQLLFSMVLILCRFDRSSWSIWFGWVVLATCFILHNWTAVVPFILGCVDSTALVQPLIDGIVYYVMVSIILGLQVPECQWVSVLLHSIAVTVVCSVGRSFPFTNDPLSKLISAVFCMVPGPEDGQWATINQARWSTQYLHCDHFVTHWLRGMCTLPAWSSRPIPTFGLISLSAMNAITSFFVGKFICPRSPSPGMVNWKRKEIEKASLFVRSLAHWTESVHWIDGWWWTEYMSTLKWIHLPRRRCRRLCPSSVIIIAFIKLSTHKNNYFWLNILIQCTENGAILQDWLSSITNQAQTIMSPLHTRQVAHVKCSVCTVRLLLWACMLTPEAATTSLPFGFYFSGGRVHCS